MTDAYLNRIATAVPPHEVHELFKRYALSLFGDDRNSALLFRRAAGRCGIERRYSCIHPDELKQDGGLYAPGAFADTAARMRVFERYAPALACQAVERLLADERAAITHLVTTCCTGFAAPGFDFEVLERCGLRRGIERTSIGFMGCQAAMNALKIARHIVRSEANARVLVLNLELCTLHLQNTADLERVLSFLIFGDGCAAGLVSADPHGLSLDGFRTLTLPESRELITWKVRNSGFEMVLSGEVPNAIRAGLQAHADDILNGDGIDLWAVHPGGRSVLDAVERGLGLAGTALARSRDILRRYGNMSSATVMFVLHQLMRERLHGETGCAMSFGPGLSAEIMAFRAA